MATPPTVNLPASACAASCVMTMTTVNSRTPSPFTLADQGFSWPGEQWTVDFSMPPIVDKDSMAEWKAFGMKLKGSYGQFYIGDPSAKVPRGIATGTPLTDGVNEQGSNILNVRGFTHSIPLIMREGDMIQVGTGTQSRLHMVVEDANSDATGRAALSIMPALRYAPNDGTALTVRDAKGLFYMTSNQWQWKVDPGPIMTITFTANEVISA